MTYTNRGRPEYSGSINEETAVLSLPDHTDVKLHWAQFPSITTYKTDATPASQMSLAGGSSIAHETQFFPRYRTCYEVQPTKNECGEGDSFFKWKEFIEIIKKHPRQIKVRFHALVQDRFEKEFTFECKTSVPDALLAQLDDKSHKITSLTCTYD